MRSHSLFSTKQTTNMSLSKPQQKLPTNEDSLRVLVKDIFNARNILNALLVVLNKLTPSTKLKEGYTTINNVNQLPDNQTALLNLIKELQRISGYSKKVKPTYKDFLILIKELTSNINIYVHKDNAYEYVKLWESFNETTKPIDDSIIDSVISIITSNETTHLISNPQSKWTAALIPKETLGAIPDIDKFELPDNNGNFGHVTIYHKNNKTPKESHLGKICHIKLSSTIVEQGDGIHAYIPVSFQIDGEDLQYGHISLRYKENDGKSNHDITNKKHCDDYLKENIESISFGFNAGEFDTIILQYSFYKENSNVSCDFDSTLDTTVEESKKEGNQITGDYLNSIDSIGNPSRLGTVIKYMLEISPSFRERLFINTSRRIRSLNTKFIAVMATEYHLDVSHILYETGKSGQSSSKKAIGKVQRAIKINATIHFDDDDVVCIEFRKRGFSSIFVDSKTNTNSNEPGKIVAVTGVPGSGKTTFIKNIEDRLKSKGMSSVCFGTDDGTPTIQDKNNLLEVSRNFYDVVFFDSTGCEQKYPKDTIIINFNPIDNVMKRKEDNFDWVSILLTSLTNIRKRGSSHPNLPGILNDKDIQNAIDGKVNFPGYFNNMTMAELYNALGETVADEFLKTAFYKPKTWIVSGIKHKKVSYLDSKQIFTSKWGCYYGRGAIIIFNTETNLWETSKHPLQASKDNGFESDYNKSNLSQRIQKLILSHPDIQSMHHHINNNIMQSKKDGMCIVASYVVEKDRSKYSNYFQNAKSQSDNDFFNMSKSQFYLTSNRSDLTFDNMKSAFCEAYQGSYPSITDITKIMKDFASKLLTLNEIINETYTTQQMNGYSVIFEIVPETYHNELACQGVPGINFLGVQFNDSSYISSSDFDKEGNTLPFPIPFYWKNNLCELLKIQDNFNEVVNGNKGLMQFLEENPPSNTLSNTSSPEMGISYEGFVVIIGDMLFKCKNKVYYDVHKLSSNPESIYYLMDMLKTLIETPHYDEWTKQFYGLTQLGQSLREHHNKDPILLETAHIQTILEALFNNKKMVKYTIPSFIIQLFSNIPSDNNEEGLSIIQNCAELIRDVKEQRNHVIVTQAYCTFVTKIINTLMKYNLSEEEKITINSQGTKNYKKNRSNYESMDESIKEMCSNIIIKHYSNLKYVVCVLPWLENLIINYKDTHL